MNLGIAILFEYLVELAAVGLAAANVLQLVRRIFRLYEENQAVGQTSRLTKSPALRTSTSFVSVLGQQPYPIDLSTRDKRQLELTPRD